MDKERSLGVTIFGILLLLATAIGAVDFTRMLIGGYEEPVAMIIFYFTEMIALRFILAIGILRLKNWARVICLWISWIGGISFIFIGIFFGIILSMESYVLLDLKFVPYATAACVLVIFFLTRPKVKEQFKAVSG